MDAWMLMPALKIQHMLSQIRREISLTLIQVNHKKTTTTKNNIIKLKINDKM